MGSLDYVVHALAFAPPATFENPFVQVAREDWKTAMDVSAYSLVAVMQRAAPLMTEGGSAVTLSYLAAERVVPHYNMMGVAKAALEASVRYLAYDLGPKGIRVNALSAGPVRTVAARSIKGCPVSDKNDAPGPVRYRDPREQTMPPALQNLYAYSMPRAFWCMLLSAEYPVPGPRMLPVS